MRRIMEHLAAYSVVATVIWVELSGHAAGGRLSLVIAALATVVLLALDIEWIAGATQERREAAAHARAVVESERLRRRAYDLCASLRLGFDICEDCWAWHPERATRELDRLRAAVGQFLSADLSTSG
ncbi:MAG TPA: hypothetical protein VM221_14370 [Armatimonadota bacterium]|nr:hypothetical protein [Armatimonadota bacterium]